MPGQPLLMFPLSVGKYDEIAVGDWTVCARRASGGISCANDPDGKAIVAPAVD